MSDVPEPEGRPLFGQLLDMRADALKLVVDVMQREGGLARLKLGPRTVFLVTDAEIAAELLLERASSLTKKTSGMAQLSLLVGNGLLTSDGEFWRRQRRIAQPTFHRKALAGFAETMLEVCDAVADDWAEAADAGREIDVNRDMMASTLRMVGRTLLSTDLAVEATEVADALDYLLVEIRARMLNPLQLPLQVPTPSNLRFRRAVEAIDSLLGQVIERRVRGEARESDLLQMLVDARDEETGEGMTAAQLRDEVVTLFVAGHETTASALAWTWRLLSLHPAARRRLEEELDGALGGRRPTPADLGALPFLGQVLDEALRLYPPAWILARQTAEPIELGGHRIPADHTVLVIPYAIHRSPKTWDNPLGFDPDRFAPAAVKTHHKAQYLPFGLGTRICIGKSFALMEAKLVLASLASRFRLDLVPDQEVVLQPAVTLRPRDGIRMRVRRR